jgi:hypothetical protein
MWLPFMPSGSRVGGFSHDHSCESIVPVPIYARNASPVNGQNFMDTARYSATQYRPQNILQTTVFKTPPPLFPLPRGGKKSGEDVQQ